MEPWKIFKRVLCDSSSIRLARYHSLAMSKSNAPKRRNSLRKLLKFLDAVCAEIGIPADNYAKAFKA